MAEHTITIQSFKFNPPDEEPFVIAVGDSVKWTNRDAARHNAVRDESPTFATRLLGEGETSDPIVFDQATDVDGIEYECGPHPFMKGRIIVTLQGSHSAGYTLQEAFRTHGDHATGTKG